jgi:hypothetical protein
VTQNHVSMSPNSSCKNDDPSSIQTTIPFTLLVSPVDDLWRWGGGWWVKTAASRRDSAWGATAHRGESWESSDSVDSLGVLLAERTDGSWCLDQLTEAVVSVAGWTADGTIDLNCCALAVDGVLEVAVTGGDVVVDL